MPTEGAAICHEDREDRASNPSMAASRLSLETTPLCNVCRPIFNGELLSPNDDGILRYPTRHHINLHQVNLAAPKCYICRELTKQVENDTEGIVDPEQYEKALNYSIFQGSRTSDTGWKSFIISIGNIAPTRMYQFELVPARDVNRDIFLDDYTGSHATLANLAALIHDCEENHTTCFVKSSNWHPSRLLEIQRCGGDKGDISVRIVELASEARIRYAALSYCWGGIVPFMLTRDSAAALYRGVCTKALPKTFRDAICVAFSLDLQYLWIDSLCIYQDDEEDWQRQAGQMDHVYKSAFVTIAATAGANSEHGLFQKRDAAFIRPPVVATQWDQSQPLLILFAWQLHRELDMAPLNQRGWVLQERLLSRRIIHFTGDQVLLECWKGITSETFPKGLPGTNGFPGVASLGQPIYTPPPKLWISDSASVKNHRVYDHKFWSESTRDYTARNLSKDTDKLVAIAGLAKIWAEITGHRYVAGMWEPGLVPHLPWMLGDNNRNIKSKPRKCHKYIAPSWSWIAWTGRITPPLLLHGPSEACKITPLAEVTNIELSYAREDTFGQLTGGWLRIRAISAACSIYHDPTNGGGKYFVKHPFEGGLDFGETGMSLDGVIVPATATLLDDRNTPLPKSAEVLLMFQYHDERQPQGVMGIVIEPDEGSDGDSLRYRRIGAVHWEARRLPQHLQEKIETPSHCCEEFVLI